MTGVQHHSWRAMGTDCHLIVHTGDPPAGGPPTDPRPIAVHLVADLEARWSRFVATSELSRINAAAGRAVTVSDLTVFAVHRALTARQETDGRFDPTVLPVLRAAGYDRDFALVGTSAPRPARPLARAAGADVTVDLDAGTVCVEQGAALDLGGIGKGLAADFGARALCGMPGVLGACLNLGGDLRCEGMAPTAAGWGVVIDDPAEPGTTLATVAFAAGGLATSSTRRRRWRCGRREAHHIIDPSRGAPAGDAVWAVTVLAATAEQAEVLATAAVVAGLQDGRQLLADAGVPALLVDAGGSHPVGSFGEHLR